MAKSIKVIECPKCGSTKKQNLKLIILDVITATLNIFWIMMMSTLNIGATDQKVFLTTFMKNNGRVVSFEIISPERLLFKPKVLCFDKDFLLISFNKTAAEESPTSIQCLNAQTGEIIFTTPLADNKTLRSAVHYKNGFVVAAYNGFVNIDVKGKIVKHFKLGY